MVNNSYIIFRPEVRMNPNKIIWGIIFIIKISDSESITKVSKNIAKNDGKRQTR
jgi:hypothetical protein